MSAAGRIRPDPGSALVAAEPTLSSSPRAACVAFVGDNQTHGVITAACEPRFPSVLVRDGGTREALEYLAENGPPRLLIVDITDSSSPLTAMLPIVAAFSQETRVIALGAVNDINLYREMVEVGVSEYLVKPVIEKTLVAALARLDDKVPESTPDAVKDKRPLVAVMGARGGVGASTVALNSAWLIAQEQKRRVALVDLDLQCGTLALALDIEPTRGLREALEHPNRIDSLFISSASAKLGERLTVMAAEESVDQDVSYDPSAIDLLIDELHRQNDCIIVDLPRTAAAARARVLATATDAVIVTDLTLAGLRDTIRLQGLTQQLAPEARVLIVANRLEAKQNSVPKKEFERALGHAVDFSLPEDVKAAVSAANGGKPLAAVAPKSKTVAALRPISAALCHAEEKPRKRFFWQRRKAG